MLKEILRWEAVTSKGRELSVYAPNKERALAILSSGLRDGERVLEMLQRELARGTPLVDKRTSW